MRDKEGCVIVFMKGSTKVSSHKAGDNDGSHDDSGLNRRGFFLEKAHGEKALAVATITNAFFNTGSFSRAAAWFAFEVGVRSRLGMTKVVPLCGEPKRMRL